MKPEKRLICALDFENMEKAKEMVESLEGVIDFFKVGIILFSTSGPEIVKWLLGKGKKIFLDLKFHDVPETVGRAVAQAARMGVSLLTIHGNAEIIKNAVYNRGSANLKLLAVTVLTSLDANDLHDLGFPCSLEKLVLYRAKKAAAYGCDGIVAAGHEARLLRKEIGDQLLIVTPGIRPTSLGETRRNHHHKRYTTPAEAVSAGADYLVVGRPITNSPHPRQAAMEIIREMNNL